MWAHIFSNKNVLWLSILCIVFSISMSISCFFIFEGMIVDATKTYDKALKFSEESKEQFAYSIKTQQGNLYAEGKLYAGSELKTHKRIPGEHLYIREIEEHYNMHTQTYECGSTDSNGVYHSRTCTRTYWSWDFAGLEEWFVDKIKLLDVEMDNDFIPWYSWIYNHVDTKDGNFYHREGNRRWSYSVIDEGIDVAFGFTSDKDGFRYNSEVTPPGLFIGFMKFVKWFLILGLLAAGILTARWFYLENRESHDNFI